MFAGGMIVHALSTFLILLSLGRHKACSLFQQCLHPKAPGGVYTALAEVELSSAVWNNQFSDSTRLMVSVTKRISAVFLPESKERDSTVLESTIRSVPNSVIEKSDDFEE